MLLKGAYCVGEHFVDPQGLYGIILHCTSVATRGQNCVYENWP